MPSIESIRVHRHHHRGKGPNRVILQADAAAQGPAIRILSVGRRLDGNKQGYSERARCA
jgi:hypothetical protein